MVCAAIDRHIARAVACCQTPDVLTVVFPLTGIFNCVCALAECGATRILVVVDPLRPHVRILNSSEINKHVRVLMTEQWCEEQMLLPVKRTPLIGLRIFGPCGWIDRMRRRA